MIGTPAVLRPAPSGPQVDCAARGPSLMDKETENALVYVVVVTYNGEQWIADCITSVLDSDFRTRVLVIDNGSTDRTVERIPTSPDVQVVRSTINLGFGKGNNIGLAKAFAEDADCVLLLNQDATVDKACIGELVAMSREHPDFGVLCPLHLNSEGSNFDGSFISSYLAPANTEFFFDTYNHQVRPLYEIPGVNAAAWLLTRSCLETVGGFDPLYFMYGEDDDYLWRAKTNTVKVGLVPGARIVHHRANAGSEKKGSRANYLSKTRNRMRSKMILFLKTHSGSFTRAWFDLFANNVATLCSLIIVERYFLNLVAFVGAFIDTVAVSPTIYRHRKLCSTPGPRWLELPAPARATRTDRTH